MVNNHNLFLQEHKYPPQNFLHYTSIYCSHTHAQLDNAEKKTKFTKVSKTIPNIYLCHSIGEVMMAHTRKSARISKASKKTDDVKMLQNPLKTLLPRRQKSSARMSSARMSSASTPNPSVISDESDTSTPNQPAKCNKIQEFQCI